MGPRAEAMPDTVVQEAVVAEAAPNVAVPEAAKAEVPAACEAPAGGSHKEGDLNTSKQSNLNTSKQSTGSDRAADFVLRKHFCALDISILSYVHPIVLLCQFVVMACNNICAWVPSLCPLESITMIPSLLLIMVAEGFMFTMMLHWGRPTVFVLMMWGAVCMITMLVLTGSSLLGNPVKCLVQIIITFFIYKAGKLKWQNWVMFTVAQIWTLVTQTGGFSLLRYPEMWSFLPEILQGCVLPCIAGVYTGISIYTFKLVVRRCMPVGVSIRAIVSITYMILAVAQGMVICGFLPRYEEVMWMYGTTFTVKRVAQKWVGAVISAMASDLISRCFLAQRTKFFLETKLGLSPKPLQVSPEVDSTFRGRLTVFWAQFVTAALFLVFVMPGEAPWPKEPLVWLGVGLCAGVRAFDDLVVVVLHRHMYPIKGESMWGTYMRLRQPFQHWPNLQCDGGAAFEKEKSRIEGTVATKASEVLPEGVIVPWSSNSIFTDERCMTMVIGIVAVQLIYGGYVAVYGWCGLWYHTGHVYCGGER